MNNFDNDFKDAIKSESDFSHIKYLKTALGRDINYKKNEHLIYTTTYHDAFQAGATWSRQFTIDEVLRWMKEDYFKYPDNQVTQAFEERFINQKEQK